MSTSRRGTASTGTEVKELPAEVYIDPEEEVVEEKPKRGRPPRQKQASVKYMSREREPAAFDIRISEDVKIRGFYDAMDKRARWVVPMEHVKLFDQHYHVVNQRIIKVS